MKNLRPFLALIFSASTFAATVASAQEPVRLTLPDAIGVAVANNRDLASSRLGIETADAQVDEAFSNALPSVGLNLRYTRNLKKGVFYFPGADGISRPIVIGADNEIATDLSVNQIVFNRAVLTGVGTAKTYAKISRQQLRSRTSEIVLNVKRAYYAAQLAKEVLGVNQTVLSNTQENFKSTTTLFKAGLRPEFDAIRAEVQLANQQPVVLQAQNNYEMAVDNLRLLLGYDENKDVEIVEPLVRPASLDRIEPAISDAYRILEENNPQLKALNLNTQVNEELITIRKSDYLPTVSVFGSLRYGAQADNFSDLDFRPTVLAGLNVSMNLFNGYKTDAQVEQATVAFEQSRYMAAQVNSALKTQLESTLRRIEYARQRIAVSEKTIDQATRGYRIAATSYKAGTGTQLQINDADLALAQSRLNQLNAVYDFNVALAELEQLLGERYQFSPDGNDVKYSLR